jgi:hypothetical protein
VSVLVPSRPAPAACRRRPLGAHKCILGGKLGTLTPQRWWSWDEQVFSTSLPPIRSREWDMRGFVDGAVLEVHLAELRLVPSMEPERCQRHPV